MIQPTPRSDVAITEVREAAHTRCQQPARPARRCPFGAPLIGPASHKA